MSNPFFYGRGCLMILLFLPFGACKKTAAPANKPITPLQTLVNTDTSLSLFHRMLLQANDAGLLANDSITLLIPTNAAFIAAGYSEMVIDSLSTSTADNMIRYGYLTSRVVPAAGTYTGYPTLSGFTIYGMTDSVHRKWFNGTSILGDSAIIGNALVYRLNAPLSAPADSLDELLEADSTLSFMAEVMLRTNLDSVLFSGSYTLLAPVNSAFIAAGYDSVGAIDSADSNMLVQLVKYHTLPGDFFTNILLGLSSVPTLQGPSVTVTAQNGLLQFSGPGNPVPANLLSGSNRLAGNTLIVHRIDQLLSP